MLRNDRIVRLVNGEERPVRKTSGVLEGPDIHPNGWMEMKIPGGDTFFTGCFVKRPPIAIKIHMNRVHEEGAAYIDEIIRRAYDMGFPLTGLDVYFDSDIDSQKEVTQEAFDGLIAYMRG